MVVHLNFIAFSSLFFAIKLVLFPDISIIACGKVPSILGRHYAKRCEDQYGVVIKSLITFSLLLLSLRGGDVQGAWLLPAPPGQVGAEISPRAAAALLAPLQHSS